MMHKKRNEARAIEEGYAETINNKREGKIGKYNKNKNKNQKKKGLR
jgi:hypothetical protein